MIKIDLKRYRREVVGGVIVLLLLIGGISVFKYTSFNSGFEIVDDLGGNIFPLGHPVGSHYGRAGDYSFGFYLSRKSEIVHRRSGEVKDCL